MIKEVGSKDFPIWLLGDSNPVNWADILATPLDPRHPARHSIWTSVLEVLQDRVYRQARLRMDTSNIYIRNAIENPDLKPKGNDKSWFEPVNREIKEFGSTVLQYKPVFLICFGAFSFEFGRRILGEMPEYSHAHWGARNLGEEFRKRVETFDLNKANLIPLLHVTIARGKFMQSHKFYCDQDGANYFDFVGNNLADLLLTHNDELNIWIA